MIFITSCRVWMTEESINMLSLDPLAHPLVKLFLIADCDSGYVRYAINADASEASPGIVPTTEMLEIELTNFSRLAAWGPGGSKLYMVVLMDVECAYTIPVTVTPTILDFSDKFNSQYLAVV